MSLRFGIAIVTAGLLAVALGVVGFFEAHEVVRWRMERMGLDQLVYMSPSEPSSITLRFAAAFAAAPLVAGGAVLVDRLRRRGDPTIRAIVAYFGVAFAALALVVVLPGLLLPSYEGAGFVPMVRALDLAPGSSEAGAGFLIAVVFFGCVWFRARPAGKP